MGCVERDILAFSTLQGPHKALVYMWYTKISTMDRRTRLTQINFEKKSVMPENILYTTLEYTNIYTKCYLYNFLSCIEKWKHEMSKQYVKEQI